MTHEDKPVFILGVGAQKAGTSWLNFQLHKNPTVDVGCSKEYHVWDSIYLRNPKRPRPRPKGEESSFQGLQRIMRSQPGSYEAYFKGLINEDVRYTGDFTPSYALLNEQHFSEIKDRLTRAGFRVKVVFLMRDPAERNWSAMQMQVRIERRSGTNQTLEDLPNAFEGFFKRPNMVRRTRYDKTVQALRNAFDEDALFFGIYEEMFTRPFASKLSTFLGLDLKEIDFNEKINAHDAIPLPLEQYESCKKYYAGVYDFCAQNFPVSQNLWKR